MLSALGFFLRSVNTEIVLYRTYYQQDPDGVRFMFKDRVIRPDDTAEQLAMDEGAVIKVQITKPDKKIERIILLRRKLHEQTAYTKMVVKQNETIRAMCISEKKLTTILQKELDKARRERDELRAAQVG